MENQRSRDRKNTLRFKEVLNGVMAFEADGYNFGDFTANDLVPSVLHG